MLTPLSSTPSSPAKPPTQAAAPTAYHHVERLRSLKASTIARGETPFASDAASLLFVEECPADVLGMIVHAAGATAIERYRALAACSAVCSGFRLALDATAREPLMQEAAYDLVRRGEEPSSVAAPGLLNLVNQRVGRLECYLLAVALGRGLLQHTESLWLQHNAIDARGLRWLARGLRAMPREPPPRLRSISLGANAFSPALDDPPPRLRSAIEQITAAANERTRSWKVRVRLRS